MEYLLHTTVSICDRICENVHSSHIHFFNFENSLNLLCTSDKHETCKDFSATIPLSVQQISNLYLSPIMFYEPLNVQNRMCELYMHVFPNPVTYLHCTCNLLNKALSLFCMKIVKYFIVSGILIFLSTAC